MKKEQINRREFIKGTAAVAGAALISQYAISAETSTEIVKKTAIDQVELGKTGIKLSRLGLGLGTRNGVEQRNLGPDGLKDLIKYAYDKGITSLDTAEAYQTHSMLAEAIKGLPREKLFIQTKISAYGGGRGGRFGRRSGAAATPPNNLEKIEGFLKTYDTEYIDSLLIHCQTNPTWDEDNKQLMEDLAKAKEKGYIRTHGISCHSLSATTKAASLDWVDVNLVRINPQGVLMDTSQQQVFAQSSESDVPPVVEQLKIMREKGHGTIGMKLIGEGAFTDIEQRKKSIAWVMQSDIIDAVIIGVKSKEEIDEAIKNINDAFAEKV
ncbi:MAG: aldo/keto reductase [Sedimentisphaerales bacterium]|nr:aldo/keto reductase [Sedimentisphaerales bacterium]